MDWFEKMKEVIGQGLDASAEIAVKAGDMAGELGGKAAELGKDAAAKVRELGERGAITLEIKRLEADLEKLLVKLGFEAYTWLVEKNASQISTEIPEIKTRLDEIEALRRRIEEREAALKTVGNR